MEKEPVNSSSTETALNKKLLSDLRSLIIDSRLKVAQTVNAELTFLYWHIGRRIRQDILKEKRSAYGKEIVAAVGRQLECEFGRGFGEKNLHRMVQFVEVFPDEEIVAALRRQLSCTNFNRLILIDEILKRQVYAEMIFGDPPPASTTPTWKNCWRCWKRWWSAGTPWR